MEVDQQDGGRTAWDEAELRADFDATLDDVRDEVPRVVRVPARDPYQVPAAAQAGWYGCSWSVLTSLIHRFPAVCGLARHIDSSRSVRDSGARPSGRWQLTSVAGTTVPDIPLRPSL